MPIVTEMVAAGFPSPALDGREEGFSLDAHVIKHPEYTFIATVAGDSMEGAGIFHGDWLVVDRSLTPEDGDVVVAVLDGSSDCCRATAAPCCTRRIPATPISSPPNMGMS